jgi:hypothetical protein
MVVHDFPAHCCEYHCHQVYCIWMSGHAVGAPLQFSSVLFQTAWCSSSYCNSVYQLCHMEEIQLTPYKSWNTFTWSFQFPCHDMLDHFDSWVKWCTYISVTGPLTFGKCFAPIQTRVYVWWTQQHAIPSVWIFISLEPTPHLLNNKCLWIIVLTLYAITLSCPFSLIITQ